MCGLVGALGNFMEDDTKALKALMIFDTTRGEDSTGLALIHDKDNKHNLIAKETGDPFTLFNSFDCFDDRGLVKDRWRYRVLMAHNRWATVGKVNARNAHPFVQGKIIGAHNGTLKSVFRLTDHDKFEVDSEAVFHNINIRGVDDTMPDVNGAYALTWWDCDQEKMFFLRNKERPLYFTRREDRDVFFWASEKWMLEIALQKYGIKFTPVQSFEVDQLYSFDLKNMSHHKMRKTNLVKEREIKGFEYKAAEVVRIGNTPFPDSEPWDWESWWKKNYKNNNGSADTATPRNGTGEGNVIGGKMSKSDMLAFSGKEVTFVVDDDCMGMGGLRYILAHPTDGSDYEIRIFIDHVPDKYNSLIHLMTVWKGKIKHPVEFTAKNGSVERYMVLDNRTIEEVSGIDQPLILVKNDPPKEGNGGADIIPFEAKPFAKGYNGVDLTFRQWEEATKQGCAWCTDAFQMKDKDEILFISGHEALCKSCLCQDDVQHYVRMAGVAIPEHFLN